MRKKRVKTVLNNSDHLVLFLHRMTDLCTKEYYGLFAQPIRSTTIAPIENMNEELFISFLVGFRHFHLTQSPVEMGRIHGIVRQGVKLMGRSDLLNDLEIIKRRFDESPQLAVDVLTVEHKPALSLSNSREILDLFLNSLYFHLDTAGLPFFFKLAHDQIVQLRNSFQWIISPYVVRLAAYVPIALKVLAAGVFPSGVAKAPPEGLHGWFQGERPVAKIGMDIGFPGIVLTDADVGEIRRLNEISLRKAGK